MLKNVRTHMRQDGGGAFSAEIEAAIDTNDMNDDIWKIIFNYDGLRRRRKFSHQVETDGEKICFHFQVNKKKHNKGKRRCRNKKKKNTNKRVISIDPGRSNLITAYDEEKKCFYRLTRRQYYRASGMKKRTKRANIRNLEMKGVYEAMSRTSTRSIHDKDWFEYQMLITRHYDKLWEFKTRRVWRKDAFRVACLKQKCLDTFFNKFKVKGRPEPMVVYGAATFNPTGKGELAVPVKYVYKKCCEKYMTEKEDEKYTTLMHHKCKGMTKGVMIEGREINGLRWCETCRELVSRDRNASVNIEKAWRSEERPDYLCDTYTRKSKKEMGSITLSIRQRKTGVYNRGRKEKNPETGKLRLEMALPTPRVG